jgi:hypothetical protein
LLESALKDVFGWGWRGTMKITPNQRAKWEEHTKDDAFNRWLNPQVRNPDGTLNLDKLYTLAERFGVLTRYDKLNPGQQRMNIGNLLRKQLDPAEYSG